MAKKKTKKTTKKKSTSKGKTSKKAKVFKAKTKAAKKMKAMPKAAKKTTFKSKKTKSTAGKTKSTNQTWAAQPKTKTYGQVTVPSVALPATGGRQVDLKEFSGKKVVLFFYPKDMTPGCTIEGREFTQLKPEFEAHNTVVLGVSRDTVESHEKFKEKEGYTVDLLADTESELCNAFHVIQDKNMYGKMVQGIERSTFVLDENGNVVKEWRGVRAEGHAQEVLNFLKGAN